MSFLLFLQEVADDLMHHTEANLAVPMECNVIVEASLWISGHLELLRVEVECIGMLRFKLPDSYHFRVSDSIESDGAVRIDHVNCPWGSGPDCNTLDKAEDGTLHKTQLDSPPSPKSRPAKDVSDLGLLACTRCYGERGSDGSELFFSFALLLSFVPPSNACVNRVNAFYAKFVAEF